MRLKEQQFEINGNEVSVEYDSRGNIQQLWIHNGDGKIIFNGSTKEASELNDILTKVMLELVSPNVEVK